MRRQRAIMRIWEINSDPADIAGCFAEIARSLDARPRKLSLTLDSSVPVSLDIDGGSGDFVVSANGARHRFSLRRRWLAEHSVPLEFGPDSDGRKRIIRLKIDPTTGNRFRVSDGASSRPLPVCWFLATALVSVAAVVTFHPVAVWTASAMIALPVLLKCLDVCLRFHRSGRSWVVV